MKKETKKKTKKESDFEMLSRLVVNGFEQIKSQMVTKEEFNKEVAEIKHEVGGIKSEVSSIKEEQKDHTRRLISIERKLTGTQISLDETVHRSEFIRLEHRVKALES